MLPLLPKGWYEAKDPTGTPYYYTADGQTSWDRPGALNPAPVPAAVAVPHPLAHPQQPQRRPLTPWCSPVTPLPRLICLGQLFFPSVVLIGRISKPGAGYQVDEEANKSVRDGDAGRSEVEEQRQGVGESGVVGCELDGPVDEQAGECRDGRPKSCNQS